MNKSQVKILGLLIELIKIGILVALFSALSENILLAIIGASLVVLVLNSAYQS